MICCLVADGAPPGALDAVARTCSPRVAPHGDAAVVFDASGLAGLFGTSAELGRDVMRLAAERQLTARVALANTTTAAWLLAHARPGISVVPAGREADALASLPMSALALLPEMMSAPEAPLRRRARAQHYRMSPGPSDVGRTELRSAVHASKLTIAVIERWGIQTLGAFARLPRADVHARLGAIGVRLHQAALGEDTAPIVPVNDAERWAERIECEWPIEGLEPLSFVLARLFEALAIRLERADRGAVDVTTRLWLVTRDVHVRTLHLPSPMREPRGLRTLALLDLESHPPAAGVDIVEVELGVAPGRIVHGSLLERALPAAEDLATLTARLGALMGETRIGAPALLDSLDERAVKMTRFAPEPKTQAPRNLSEPRNSRNPGTSDLPGVLRRFRLPIAARVTEEHHTPVRVMPSARGLAGGRVVACAGPWRSSGQWWALDRSEWDRDEWDVELTDGVFRLSRDRRTGYVGYRRRS